VHQHIYTTQLLFRNTRIYPWSLSITIIND